MATSTETHKEIEMYPNPLKQRLIGGELILGTNISVPSPYVVGPALDTRPDFIWIDTEHMPYGAEALDTLPVIIRQRGAAPLIRVAWNDPALIKKAYDVGAVAVMVPQVSTPEEAARAVQYAHYYPEGQRGISPMWTRIIGEDWNQVIKTANEETVLVLQIESRLAYENLDEIKKVPGIDVLLVGPLDLSATVGTITDTRSHEVQEIMRDVPRRLEGTGIAAGTTLMEVDDVREKIRWGYRFINVGSVIGYGTQVVGKNLEALRADPTGEG
jgi:4-hydroxy-2-oxoheptanedioate aldolase